METIPQQPSLPPPPARLFCVGIGGIGVSALAQLLVHLGYDVAGSDRGLDDPSKAHLYERLRHQGIRLYPQDGSGVRAERPDALVISNAVEPGNPDLTAASPDTPVIHRARALAQALDRTGTRQIAVAGSCGKTSVTGWLAAALRALGEPVILVNGGYDLAAETPDFPGNFLADPAARFAVVEVDESDKSLVQFTPHYGVLLNVGNDHYSQDELRQVFATFLRHCREGIACLDELAGLAWPTAAASRWRPSGQSPRLTSSRPSATPPPPTASASTRPPAARASTPPSRAATPPSTPAPSSPSSACSSCRRRRRRSAYARPSPPSGASGSASSRWEAVRPAPPSSTTTRTTRRRSPPPWPLRANASARR